METSSQSNPLPTWKPTVGGILSIISGAVAVLVGIGVIVRVEFARRMVWHWQWEVAAALALVLGVIAIVGGICALNRRVWGLALAGAICALFPPHVAVLGILAIIFVALSKGEFNHSAPRATAGTVSSTETKQAVPPESMTPPDKGSRT
jgi:hypothetical protein